MLYGGSIAPGPLARRDVTIQDVFEAIGAHAAGDLSDAELHELEGCASPGAGACGGQFTANTMACAFEAMGISPMGSAMVPAMDGQKREVARAGRAPGAPGAGRRPSPQQGDHPGVAGERDRLRLRLGRLHERRPAPLGHRARGRDRAGDRRLRAHLAPHPAARRPEARREVRRDRPLQGGRRGRDRQAARRGRPPPSRGADRHAGERRRGGERERGDPGPGGRSPPLRAGEARGRPGGPAREPRPRGLRGQARRHRAAQPHGPGARVRVRGGCILRRSPPRRSSPATWS